MLVAYITYSDEVVKRYELTEKELAELKSLALKGTGWISLENNKSLSTYINLDFVIRIEIKNS